MIQCKSRVHGLGGELVKGTGFNADDPAALAAWYRRHLGVGAEGWGGAMFPWRRDDTGERACTVWSPTKADTRYFEPSDKPYMLNFRVDDPDAVLAALRDEDCRVLDRREDGEQGRFGYVVDADGMRVERWQPNPHDPAVAAV